jgi:cell wall assembly regulator SMI1
MIAGFDVGRARAGLWDRHRALEFIREFDAAWTRPLLLEDGYGKDVLRSVEEHLGVRLPAALREAFLMLRKRADLPAVQDHLLALDRLAWTSRGRDRVPQGESELRGVGSSRVRSAGPARPSGGLVTGRGSLSLPG